MQRELSSTSLSPDERRTLEQFAALLEERLGDAVIGAWLYGSRARGERRDAESDIDVLVVTRAGDADRDRVSEALFEAAEAEGADPFRFSVGVVAGGWVEQRRKIASFFIREVDRDKIVLAGGS